MSRKKRRSGLFDLDRVKEKIEEENVCSSDNAHFNPTLLLLVKITDVNITCEPRKLGF